MSCYMQGDDTRMLQALQEQQQNWDAELGK